MKVFMIGGTGLLGCEAARIFIERGHQVKSVALPPLPEGAPIPEEMEIIFGNINDKTDEEIKEMMKGCDSFIFAAGVDERIEYPAPVYDVYHKFNIAPLERMLPLAKECGLKNAVILGSYFAYLAKERPDMKLTEQHPYIRSRIDQENVAFSYADENFDVAVLELPYILEHNQDASQFGLSSLATSNDGQVPCFLSRAVLQCLQLAKLVRAIVGAVEYEIMLNLITREHGQFLATI